MTHSVLLVHSDARAISLVMRGKMRLPSSYVKLISSVIQHLSAKFERQTIILPTFNYDFTSTNFFDVENDGSQVGAITEIARTELKWRRNATPVYSFISENLYLQDDDSPFKKDSVLGSIQNGGLILLLGVSFEKLTFLHVMEEELSVPYRYTKRFEGKVRHKNGQIEDKFVEFHVRPKGLNLEYDFAKLGEMLVDERGAWKDSEFSHVIDAELTSLIIKQKLSEDPLFALTKESRRRVEERLEQLGRPFEIRDFE